MDKCGRCGRRLKSPDAVNAGYGKVCWSKLFHEPFPTQHTSKPKVSKSSVGHALKSEKADAMPLFATDVVCRRGENGEVITNVPQRIVFHSPDGFEWGYCGSGPADFALNILSLYIGQEAAEEGGLYQRFKEDFIAQLPEEGETIKRDDILAWLEQYGQKKSASQNG